MKYNIRIRPSDDEDISTFNVSTRVDAMSQFKSCLDQGYVYVSVYEFKDDNTTDDKIAEFDQAKERWRIYRDCDHLALL